MNEKEMFCNYCDDIVEFELKEAEILHKIKDEEIKLNVCLPFCKSCGNQLSDLEIEEQHFNDAINQYRRMKNLLSPEDIKLIRESYGLSQRAFARTLGISEATMNRYELGALQDTVYNNLMLLIKEPNNMMRIAVQNKDKISSKEFNLIKTNVNKMLNDSSKNIQENTIIEKLDLIHKKLEKDLERKIDVLIKDSSRRETNDNEYKQLLIEKSSDYFKISNLLTGYSNNNFIQNYLYSNQ